MNALVVLAVFATVTAGWENVSPGRKPFPPAKVLWTADLSSPTNFTWELREGATGAVEITTNGIRIIKSNDAGYLVVKGRAFAVEKGRKLRGFADQESFDADVDYSSGVIRGHGRTEKLTVDGFCERKNFWNGGLQTMRGFPCTPPGMPYRKYGDFTAEDDVFTPALVVSGTRSTSVWTNWTVEDLESSNSAWWRTHDFPVPDYSADLITDAELDRRLAADVPHTVEVRRIGGVSRLVADGEIVAPVAYHASVHVDSAKAPPVLAFAGKPLDGSAVKVVVKPLARDIPCRPDGSGVDYGLLVDEVRGAMRASPDSLFVLGVSGNAPRDFIRTYHPEEAWINEKGEPVYGVPGSCIIGYLGSTRAEFEKRAFPWPSPASRVWRDWMCGVIRGLVAELKARGLDKRIVGIHVRGYHDGQYSIPYIDQSRPAKEEYARMIAEPGYLSTNYAFCVKQMAFRAQEEFVRAFKDALGKPSIGVMWCESPFQGSINASLDLTSFCRSDAMDIVVCQPNYRERLPAFPTVSAVPVDSFHLHGKLFWNEYDYRTYAPVSVSGSSNTPVSEKSVGTATDIEMWRTMYRKVAGEADATRMGYWLYDMRGGWYYPPEIAADIRGLAAEEAMLARREPSVWRPDMAVVVDEEQILQECDDPLRHITLPDEYIYASSCRLFGTSGVPYERYLADDVLTDPALLRGKRIVVLAFFRWIDARRKALLEHLAAQGTTLVYLSETGIRGGGEDTGFVPVFRTGGSFGQEVVPEPGVTDNVKSLLDVYVQRERNCHLAISQRCTVEEVTGVRILARYAADGLPAIAERRDSDCRRVYVAAPGALTPGLLNRLARESGAYAAVDGTGLQIDMNGDFVSVHCLRPGSYDFRLPFPCAVDNLRSGMPEPVRDGCLKLTLSAGETCRFALRRN